MALKKYKPHTLAFAKDNLVLTITHRGSEKSLTTKLSKKVDVIPRVNQCSTARWRSQTGLPDYRLQTR